MKTLRLVRQLSLLLLLLGTARVALAQDAKPSDSPPPREGRAASVQQISAAAAAVFRTSPFDPPDASDISFYTDAAPRLDTGCTFRSGGPLVYTIEIKRFLGELNPDGTLKDAAALVAAGLLSPTVKLIMPGFDIDSGPPPPDVAPEIDRVSFNGQPVGVLSGHNNQWVLNSFEIPVERVKFARRGTGGGEPVGGVNEIRIDIDTANLEEVWCTSVDWGSASFKAMSPVILIHGNGSDGKFFERRGFTNALAGQGLLYDDSISMETTPRSKSAEDLNARIPGIVREFGAKKVHLVTHSKGGLDARDYLARFQREHNEQFEVLSLTTLSGPHNGSVGADVRVERKIAAANVGLLGKLEFVGFPDYTNEVARMMGVDPATPDLTIGANAIFNRRNVPRLRGLGITYNTVGADADQNRNNQIDRRNPDEFAELREESKDLRRIDLLPFVSRRIVDIMYKVVRDSSRVTVTYSTQPTGRKVATIRSVPTMVPQPNDTMVTTASARGEGHFESLVTNKADFMSTQGRNHASVANDGVAYTVIPWLRLIERRSGGLR